MKNEANDIYKTLVQNPLNDNLVAHYSFLNDQIHSIMRKIAIENDQRMKINWLIKGNGPSTFFLTRLILLYQTEEVTLFLILMVFGFQHHKNLQRKQLTTSWIY